MRADTTAFARVAVLSALSAAVIGFAALVALGPFLPRAHGFGQWIAEPDLADFARNSLTSSDLALVKLDWLMRQRPVKVAVFGNSRTVHVSAARLGVKAEDFINASQVDTGINQASWTLLQMARNGAAPQVALVQIDPIGHAFWGEVRAAPRAYLRPNLIVDEALAMARRGVPTGIWGRAMVDDARLALTGLASDLKGATVLSRLRYVAAGYLFPLPEGSPDQALLPPGPSGEFPAREGQAAKPPPVMEWVEPGPLFLSIMAERWRSYIQRLREVRETHGTRVVLFEFPVAPNSMAMLDAQSNRWFEAARAQFRADALAAGLEFHGPLPLDPDDRGLGWGDGVHPPPEYAGRQLRRLLAASP